MRGAYLHYLAGVLVAVFGLMAWPTSGLAAYGDYISATSAGSLNQPAKVTIDESNGSVYVTDAGNKAVKRYTTADGDNYTYDAGFSLTVAGTPVGIAFDERVPLEDMFYVGDDTNDCVWIYDSAGNLADLSGTGTTHKLGSGATPIKMPNTVVMAPSGHIFVVDGDSDTVYIFNADGTLNSSFGTSGAEPDGLPLVNNDDPVGVIQCYYPTGLAFADYTEAAGVRTQYLYLGDQGNNRVIKISYQYNTSTNAITPTGAPTREGTIPVIATTGPGDAFGKFLRVSDLIWDKYQSRLIVADSLQMVCQMFNSSGATLNQALNYSAGVQGYLNVPTGIVFNPLALRAIVASNQTESIVVFDLAACSSVPSITVDTPASATPLSLCTDNPYPVNFTTADLDSPIVTVTLYRDADQAWNGGNGAGEGIIGTWTGAPGAGSVNWNVITLDPSIPQYYVRGVVVDEAGCSGAAYSLGYVSVGDADSDGLNNIFEDCYAGCADPYIDCDNDGLLTIDEQAHGTNPLVADTDGGGVRDGIEVAKGTDPLNPADDRTSAVDLVGPFFNAKASAGWKTTYYIMNTDPANTAYLDVSFFNMVGGGHLTTKNFTLPPNGFVSVNPADYVEVVGTTFKGNVECRTSGGRCVGYSTQENWSTANPTRCFFTVSCDMATPADFDSTIYGCFWNTKVNVWETWYLIKNVSDSSVTISCEFKSPTGGDLGLPPTEYTISGHSNATFSPANIYNPASIFKGNVVISVVSGTGKILGYQLQYKVNSVDAGVAYDFGYSELMGTNATLMMDAVHPRFNTQLGSNETWILLQNPGSVAADVDAVFYSEAGATMGSTQFAVTPGSTSQLSPYNIVGNGVGSTELTVTGGSGLFGYGYQDQNNTYNPTSVKDFAKTSLLIPMANMSTDLYGAYVVKNLDGWDTEIVLKNAQSVAVTANLYFYNAGGTQVATDTQIIPAKGSVALNTGTYDFGGATEVSLKVSATDVLCGYLAAVRHDTANPNPDLSDKFEGAFGINLQK